MGCPCNSGGGNGGDGGQVNRPMTGGGSCSGPLAGQQQMGGSYNSPNFAPVAHGGRTRRRKHTRRHRRSGTRKTRGHGRKRACKCPGGCKRSTCPCCTGKRFCCTKRCRGCKC